MDSMNDKNTYDPKYFQPLFDAEDRHFWFITRNQILENVLAKLDTLLPNGYYALESGCGDGNTLRVLESTCHNGKVIGSDLFHSGLLLAQKRVNCPLVQADVTQIPFPPIFHLSCIFDVLEHISDDKGMLTNIYHSLVKGGYIVLTVPAGPELWSYFDDASHHIRRYTRDTLKNVLEKAGFRIITLTAFMSLTYPIVWLRRKGVKKNSKAPEFAGKRSMQELEVPTILNWSLVQILRFESAWLKMGNKFSVGSSLLAIAQKD